MSKRCQNCKKIRAPTVKVSALYLTNKSCLHIHLYAVRRYWITSVYLRKAPARNNAALLIAHVSRCRRNLCSVRLLFFISAFNSFNELEA